MPKARNNSWLAALTRRIQLLKMFENAQNAGQIVRIQLENFMSYDNIEIHPGNHLNLIIGPNGTGKSSIVCAVLLCLGGKLKALGRAEQLSSYIKTGCNQSSIEIELCDPNSNNVIVKRKILSTNQSEYMINGKTCAATKVNEIRKKYNIQIDNLCTFLPQEKVHDFAKLNNQQLLDQTQRIVGNGELVQLHEELKKLQSKIVEQEKHNCILQDELENEKQKNDRLKDKIKCFKEKQLLCDKLIILKQKKGWIQYLEELKSKNEIDKDFETAQSSYVHQKNELEKFNNILVQLDDFLKKSQQKVQEVRKFEAGKKSVMEDRILRAEKKINGLEDLRKLMELSLKEEESKKKEMQKCKESAEKLKNDLKNFNDNIGLEMDLQKQKKETDSCLKKIHDQEVHLNQIKADFEEGEFTLQQELRNTLSECQNLKRRRDIRLEYLKRHEPDVYKAMEWLKKNRNLFHSKIYDPMLLELDVPDSKMAKFVEARLGYKDLISFTCTNSDDLNLLIKNLRTEQKLKINAICSEDYENTQYMPEIPLKDLKDLGFYAYMKDLIQGPNEILRFLCKTYRIHCIPIGDERVKSNCNKVPKNISLFYSDNHVFSVKYSVYSGENSISVKKLGESKFFSQSVDEGKLQNLLEKEQYLQKEITKQQKNIKDIDNQINELRTNLKEVINKKKQLETFVEVRHQIEANLQLAMDKHDSVKESLKDFKEIKQDTEKKRQVLLRDIEKNLEDLKQSSENFEKVTLERQKCEILFKIYKFGKKQILEDKACFTEKLVAIEKQLRVIKDHQREAECRCLELMEKAKKLTDNVSIEEQDFQKFENEFRHFPNTVNEIEMEIEETQTKADFLQGGNLEILREYEEREVRIRQLSTSLNNFKENLEIKKRELNSKRDAWLYPINDLISNINEKFGHFFEAMDCAGEVSFVSGENENEFDQYGIKIKVKFRSGTPFQELGRYFQSGGERAVAIAIFLLSLQELTSVPFRFVDEINQGMDPENERRIMELIIRVTSSQHSSQYFFITPKLLTDIKCSDTMTVLCIYNGPNAVPSKEWDMKKFLKHKELENLDEEI